MSHLKNFNVMIKVSTKHRLFIVPGQSISLICIVVVFKSYFVILMPKYDFIKYDKYAFPKYVVFKKYEYAFPKYDWPKCKYAHIWPLLIAFVKKQL